MTSNTPTDNELKTCCGCLGATEPNVEDADPSHSLEVRSA